MRVVSLIFIFLNIIFTQRTTKFVGLLLRHGSRYPIKYEDQYLQGQLNNNGIRMSYLLGTYFKDKYKDFFTDEQYNFNENYLISSSLERCLMTAQAFMIGMYDFGSLNDPITVDEKYIKPQWENFDIPIDFKTALPYGFQPVPVHSNYPENNYLFGIPLKTTCRNSDIYKKRNEEAEQEFLQYLQKEQEVFESYGIPVKEIIQKDKISEIKDIYVIEDYATSMINIGQLKIPDEYAEKLSLMSGVENSLTNFNTPELNKLYFNFIALLLKEKLLNAKNAVVEGKESYEKFLLMTGHDQNITNLFFLWDLVSYECLNKLLKGEEVKGYCLIANRFNANVIFELYEENNQYYVELLYNNNPFYICNNKNCTFEQFIDKLDGIILNDDKEKVKQKYCLEKQESHSKTLLSLIIFNIVLIVILIILIFYFKQKKNDALIE